MTTAYGYARALYELQETGTGEPSAYATKLLQLLERKGYTKLLPDILREFERITDSARDDATLTLTCARTKDLAKYRDKLKEHFGHSGKAFTKELIDDTLIGGYVLRNGDTVVDASYKNKLLLLYRSVIA